MPRLNIFLINILPNILPSDTNITSSWQSYVLMSNDLGNKSYFHWELFTWNKLKLGAANMLAVDYGTHLQMAIWTNIAGSLRSALGRNADTT